MKLTFAILFSAAGLTAQLLTGSATITGFVVDPSGARVPNATVAAINMDSLTKTTAVANAVGIYSVANLPAGRYNVEVRVPGFRVFHKDDLTVINGGAARADAHLDLGEINESVVVRAQGVPRARQVSAQSVTQDHADPKPIRVGGNVMQANLASRVVPVYPADMKAQGLEAVVQLQAVISKEGIPQSLNVVSTDVNRAFIDAAIEAVKQWRYKPTLLNGEPVEVITRIDINFTLSQ